MTLSRTALARIVVGAALLLALGASAHADGYKPGSVLVFPVHRSGPTLVTIVCVTNTNTLPSAPFTFGGATVLHYEYVNVWRNMTNPLVPIDCTVFDRYEFLTPADTLCLLTSCHDAVLPNGQEGYLVVSAQDPAQFDVPWAFDHLIGSELVVNGSGGMYALEAIPFRSVETAPGIPTDFNGNGALDFDGLEYEQVPDTLYLDTFLAVAGSHLTLVNLTGGPLALNTVLLEIWNDAEFPLSTTFEMSCWFDHQLTKISFLFEPTFLRFSTPHDPTELDLDCDGGDETETGWVRIDSLGVHLVGGTFVSDDGALLGCLSVGPDTFVDGGRLLWESEATQDNGLFFVPKLP